MRYNFQAFFLLGLVALMTMPFTNCDNYSDGDLFGTYNSACKIDVDCFKEDSALLEVRINTQNDLPVAAGVSQFNVGGECNEGGYADNQLIWELKLDNTMVSNSALAVTSSKCVNGRFSLLVVLPKPGLLDANNIRRAHDLYVEVIGVSSKGLVKNQTQARKKITLQPSI